MIRIQRSFAEPKPISGCGWVALAIWFLTVPLLATAAEDLFYAGKYEACLEKAKAEVDRGVWNERWPTLLIRSQMRLGRYHDAKETYEAAIRRYSSSLTLRLMAVDIYRLNGLREEADRQSDEIFRLVQRSPQRYTSRANLIALGRYFLERGEDARQILELFYDRVLKADSAYVDAHVATAELALRKFDYKIAADAISKAIKLRPNDPDLHCMLAKAWRESDSEKATAALAKALELNPRHVPSRLLQVDRLIDAEQYTEAQQLLTQVLAVNPTLPEAWAYHVVIAHLQGFYDAEPELRDVALGTWAENPGVDLLIGKKLSQKYRFKEAAEYLNRSLGFDASFSPARFELAQCLLRLGDEELGWQLANQLHKEDGYNVVAHNLVTLHDRIKKFTTLQREQIIVRMETREAKIYGEAVLDLLQQAKLVLCEKYDMQPEKPVIVEIFPQQNDFAIRTFGLPAGDGFLGVCFGRVITANSPASRGNSPSNWKAVLWHEFCHVVTLEKTNNRMPRWLSEGISVYEERQRNPAWGEKMTPEYRSMILGDDLTPVSQLSAAFLRPKSPTHLQFAYYESSLVVEFLIETYGFDTLKRILDDLGVGMQINQTLQRYTGSLDALDTEFAVYAKEIAEKTGDPKTDWSRDELPNAQQSTDWATWNGEHPNNFWGLRRQAADAMRKQDWEAAEPVLLRLRALYPEDASPGNALAGLARVYRELGNQQAEREVLEQLVQLDADAVDAAVRLTELAADAAEWSAVADHAQYLLDLNPLLPIVHERAVKAFEELGESQRTVQSLRALAEMNPTDPAKLHLQTAQTLHRLKDKRGAKRQVLMALEEAPRYREAQKLLLQLVDDANAPSKQEATTP